MWFIGLVLFGTLMTLLQSSNAQTAVPDAASVLNCCEGDIVLVLDSSGSISSYEFSRLLQFLTELLRPFSLGRGHVRIGLLQVGTEPHLEFGLDSYNTQASLQNALLSTRQLLGDTNTAAALLLAKRLLSREGTALPKVLLWLTDGVQPGDVDRPMSELKQQGATVLAVSTGHGNYRLLQRVVSPPVESHLYFVNIDDINIITEDLREAIIEVIGAVRLRVVHLSSHSAVLQWSPVMTADTGFYHLRYGCIGEVEEGTDVDGSCPPGLEHQCTLPGDSTWEELASLKPDTTYTVSLTPKSNQKILNTLSVTFTTLPEDSPAVVIVSDSGLHHIRISWGPLQPIRVRNYRVEYGAIPYGSVHTVLLQGHENSTLLTSLEPGTEYLVTVSALHTTGRERAMSVKACTHQASPALEDLRLTPLGQGRVQVAWTAHQDGLTGYWLSWEERSAEEASEKPPVSSMQLPSVSRSAHLTHLAPGSRVCVSPVYSTGRGDGICCTAEGQPVWLT